MVDEVELERRRAVVKFIEQRVEDELHVSWRKVSDLAGVVESLIRRIRRNPEKHGLTPRTAAGLDRALQLEPGSIERMLKGEGDPVRKAGSPGAAPQAPDGAPTSMVDILRRWNRVLTGEDAVQLADDLFTVYAGARKVGYDEGFKDGRAVLHDATNDPATPSDSSLA